MTLDVFEMMHYQMFFGNEDVCLVTIALMEFHQITWELQNN